MVFVNQTINPERYNLEYNLEIKIILSSSIYQFSLFVEIDDIIEEIEKLYLRKPQFHAKGMPNLAIAYHFYGKSYEKLPANISTFDV